MKILVNRTGLARRLNIAPETLRAKIDRGEITADAKDDLGRDLFDISKHAKPQLHKS